MIVYIIFILILTVLFYIRNNFYFKILYTISYVIIADNCTKLINLFFRSKDILYYNNKYYLNYTIEGKKYILIIKTPIENNNEYTYLDDNNKDVTDLVLCYLGPNNCHVLTPNLLGFESLKRLDVDGETIFYKNDILKF